MRFGTRAATGLAVATIMVGWVPDATAQGSARFMRECGQWVEKKGYSVDYLEQRTGVRPSGNMAGDMRSNLDTKDVQPGDVVFLATNDAGGQRAEVVDEVIRGADGNIEALKTSSMNIGKMVEPGCNITENFGKVVQRRVAFDRVQRAWRPEKR
jgi:hypothetical protein